MKLLQAALGLLALAPLSADADNTPNLCTDDIPNLVKIRPSATADHPIPDITVGSTTYSGDAEHFVVRPPLIGGAKYKRVLVYIPGTTDRPELSSCLIKSAAESLNVPVLALSYQYLSRGDKFRNQRCEVLGGAGQVECLEEQHRDAIDGGDYGATHFLSDGSEFWAEVLPENSLKRRLGDLLAYLHETYPVEGWDRFFEGDGGANVPRWRHIVASGHSQGAGHVAYLARTRDLRGAVMISGPQDECLGCAADAPFWIDEEGYSSGPRTFYTALGHGNEPLIDVMRDNWARMEAAEPSINWSSAVPADVGFALDTTYDDACASPLVTDVQYAPTSTCGGKPHCSTAIDDSVPFVETWDGDKLYLYEFALWPAILRGADDKFPCRPSSSSGSKSSKSSSSD